MALTALWNAVAVRVCPMTTAKADPRTTRRILFLKDMPKPPRSLYMQSENQSRYLCNMLVMLYLQISRRDKSVTRLALKVP